MELQVVDLLQNTLMLYIQLEMHLSNVKHLTNCDEPYKEKQEQPHHSSITLETKSITRGEIRKDGMDQE